MCCESTQLMTSDVYEAEKKVRSSKSNDRKVVRAASLLR